MICEPTCLKPQSHRHREGDTGKRAFFDLCCREDWAFLDYSDEKHRKLDRYLDIAGVKRGHRVLEPGCGTGRFTRKLSERVGEDGEVVAVDISPKMIEACRHRAGRLPNVRILQGAVEQLVCPPRCFDSVFCLCVFPHFDDKVETLSFFNRVLKNSGVLMVAHTQGRRILNELHGNLGGAVEQDRIPPFSEMQRIFAEAGFRIAAFMDKDEGYYISAGIDMGKRNRRGGLVSKFGHLDSGSTL